MSPETVIILSSVQVGPLFDARRKNLLTVTVSPDLGLSMIEVAIQPEGIRFPNGESLSWAHLEKINAATTCFLVRDGEIEKVQRFL